MVREAVLEAVGTVEGEILGADDDVTTAEETEL